MSIFWFPLFLTNFGSADSAVQSIFGGDVWITYFWLFPHVLSCYRGRGAQGFE